MRKITASKRPLQGTRGVLHISGRLPLSATATVEPVGPEVLAPGKLAGSLVKVTSGGRTWLDQTEALSWWHSREHKAIAKRSMTVMLVEEHAHLDMDVTVLLMLDNGLPRTLPPTLDYDRKGGFGGARPNW